MTINIIKADYAIHGKDIINLLSGYALDPMGGGEVLTSYVKDNLINELSKLPHAFSVLAFKNDKAVGLINCFEGFSTFACKPLINIHDVTVHKDYRGLGISQKMLAKVESTAKKKNCCKLTLEILSKNDIAQSAYQKFGFASYCLDPSLGSAVFWQKTL